MVQIATSVNFGDFHRGTCEPISKQPVEILKGNMAHLQTRERWDVSVGNSVNYHMGQLPEVSPARSNTKWGVPQEMFSSVEQFRGMSSTAAFSASLAGQAPSVNLHTR